MDKRIGIYIHIPFCAHKCPYCDFYSKKPTELEMEKYKRALIDRIKTLGEKYPYAVDTVYFGGGTPSVMGAGDLSEILGQIRASFRVFPEAEVTTEANPESVSSEFFREIKSGGFNRLSMGLQSANEEELKLLGRAHSCDDVKTAVKQARQAGIENITLDIMMGLPGQNVEKLSKSIDFCVSLGIPHISSYILKVEEKTVFGRKNIRLPEDEIVSDLYLFAAEKFKENGYNHYEISNFAISGFESKHNLKYWNCQEYLGVGPGAHSFMDGKRFYFSPNIKSFIDGDEPIQDGIGGDFEEYAMLRLRLAKGLVRADLCSSFLGGNELFEEAYRKAKKLPPELVQVEAGRISLTAKGFLVSNAIIEKLIL